MYSFFYILFLYGGQDILGHVICQSMVYLKFLIMLMFGPLIVMRFGHMVNWDVYLICIEFFHNRITLENLEINLMEFLCFLGFGFLFFFFWSDCLRLIISPYFPLFFL